MLMDRYANSRMRLEDAENIYQDVFLAIQENLKNGTVRQNTVWSNYIMTIGLNQACKQYRTLGKTSSLSAPDAEDRRKDEEIDARIDALLRRGETVPHEVYENSEAQAILGEELDHTPEPCASLIRATYYQGLSDKEVMEELDMYKSTVVVRTRRWQCMRDLIYRVKLALFNAGIIDEKPERRKRNNG